MSKQVDLLIRIERGSTIPHRVRVCGTCCFDVLDMMTHTAIRVSAEDISPYRHTLLMDGTAYEILNVFKLA
jgi:hypothetical protein